MESIALKIALGAFFVSVMGGTFSVLLVISEKRILNYGICPIRINDDSRVLEVMGGASLLSALHENSIFIPSACGGRGSCAYCKLKVLSGAGPVTPVEDPYLSAEERAQNIRLSCQVKVRNELRIAIPDELFRVRRFEGIVCAKKMLTKDIVSLVIEIAGNHSLDFTAGQYVQLESRPYKGREAVMRAYSIASPPSQKDRIELLIRKVPDGICTTWVFDVLKEKDPISFSGPYGDFRLRDGEGPAFFVAGGTGMAPILSILEDMREKGIFRKTDFIFGANTQADLLMLERMKELQRALPGLAFVPTLSAEPEGTGWTGARGFVTQVLEERYPDCSECEAYLCGSPAMVRACVSTLTSAGMPEEKVYYDKFG